MSDHLSNDLLHSAATQRFGTILADPPWQFQNRTKAQSLNALPPRKRAKAAA